MWIEVWFVWGIGFVLGGCLVWRVFAAVVSGRFAVGGSVVRRGGVLCGC